MSSNHHPEKINIENPWIFESLNLPSVKVSKEDIKSKWEHLKDISIETSNLEISLLIGADMPYLHISLDVVSGHKNNQIGVLTKLGWVIMGGKSTAHKKVSSNSIISSHNTLENTVQRFWEVDSFGTVAKNDPPLLPLNEGRALDILESTCTKLNDTTLLGYFEKKISHTYQTTEILPFQE